MPCHDDWLNDLSSMPPVSVTMQPKNLPLADVPAVDVPPELPAELEPQPAAAASTATMPNAATVLNIPLTVTSCAWRPVAARKDRRLGGLSPPAGVSRPGSPPGLPEG